MRIVDDYYDVLFLGGSVLERHWGQVENELRLPLVPISTENSRQLRKTLRACKVLR